MMHRYPGPRSFTGDDRHLFFGRDREKQELFRLIVLNDLTVMFGESGSGKTSLLQAGVCPDLEERQYKPVFIRLNNPAESPELQVCHQLKEGGYIPADMPEDLSLWEYFSRFWYVDLGEVYTPAIVFDQFEELFTLYQPEERAAFIEQFAAIANRRPPTGLAPAAATPPKTKFVLSLRSDFLYLLDELSADIPAILRCRFQLRLLDRDRAVDAITRPAGMTGDYASPIFAYHATALKGILEALGRRENTKSGATSSHPDTSLGAATGEIAAFQLQLVCRHLEEKIIRQNLSAGFIIMPDFYGGPEGIRQIIEDFYNQVIEKVAPAERLSVERLLGKGLVRNGRRIMMEASAIREEYGVSQAALELLHEVRLLKREARKGDLYYEISHDTLVIPILERYKKIEAAELAAAELAAAEQLRSEEELKREMAAEEARRKEMVEKLELVSNQRKLARWVGVLSLIMVLMMILFLFWFIASWARSTQQEFRLAEENCRQEQFPAARSGIDNLRSSPLKYWLLVRKGESIDAFSYDVTFFGKKYNDIERLTKLGDSLLLSSYAGYAAALSTYRQAQDSIVLYNKSNYHWTSPDGWRVWRINPLQIEERQYSIELRITNAQYTIFRNFILLQREKEAFEEAKVYGQIYRTVNSMKALIPKGAEDIAWLQNKLGLYGSVVDYVNLELRLVEARLKRF